MESINFVLAAIAIILLLISVEEADEGCRDEFKWRFELNGDLVIP